MEINSITKHFKNTTILAYIGLAIVLALIIIIRLNFLTIPFERDEGAYAYSGKILLEGAKTYRDIGSPRLDGIFYAYALIIDFFGYSIKELHIAFLLINLANTILLFFLTLTLTNKLTAFSASLFFSLLSMSPFASGFTIQSEHLVVLFVIAGFLSLFHFLKSKRVLLLITAGILFSFAFQIKQTCFFYGVLAAMIIIINNYYCQKSAFFKIIKLLLVFSASVVLPILIDLFIIYKNGVWTDFNIWFFDVRKQYTSAITFKQGLLCLKLSFINISRGYELFWIFSFLGPILIFFTEINLWIKITFGGLFVAGFLTVMPGNHYYGHYFLQWMPAVSIGSAVFIFSIYDFFKKRIVFCYTIISLLIVFPVLLNLIILRGYYFNPNHTKVLRNVYGLNPFPESKVIADKLNLVMKPDDKLAVLGTEIQMYVYTIKKSPSRFAGSGALLEFPISKSKDWQNEFITDVEKASPRFLVFFSNPTSWMINPTTINLLFPWFNKFVNDKYKVIGFADIYNDSTNYIWEPYIDLVKNPPRSPFRIFVFERNNI